ncbi:DUF1254 domain-containing protein [Tsukamurella soli]|uniref:DUF1254 domain-containing protein n=2 Tax=Tsukamurella soli TaxID=644556 RepID=A0ABP8JHK5_9ACTN
MLIGMSAAAVGAAAAACGTSSNSAAGGSSASPSSGSSGPDGIASDAYVFGYPLVLMDATRAAAAPANRFSHAPTIPGSADRTVVRLNQDTLYSQAWLDLSAEPVVVQVPDMGSRYWLLPVLDAWTNVVHNPSSVRPQLQSGATRGPFTYAFTGPSWKGTLPVDVTPMPVPTNMAWILGRVQVDGEHDLSAVHAVQAQITIAPLSAWTRTPGTSNPPASASAGAEPVKTVADMSGTAYFEKLNALMVANPAAAAAAPALARFATVGIKPGSPGAALPADRLDTAVEAAQKRFVGYKSPTAKFENGWRFDLETGRYGTDYLQRAFIARIGLGANLPEDSLYPTYFGQADSGGTPRRFLIRFAPGQLPPVDAFWSITAYDAQSFFYPNPDEIFSVGHQTPPLKNPDGSVDIYIQNARPEQKYVAGNWLPIPPAGAFSLTLRLYAPKTSASTGRWQPPAVQPQA